MVKRGDQDGVGAIGVSVAGVVSVDWLDGGSGGGNGCCCFASLSGFASAFAGIASDKGIGGVNGNRFCLWCKHPWKDGGRQ